MRDDNDAASLSPKHRAERKSLLAAVQEDGLALIVAKGYHLKNDKQVVLAAVQQNGCVAVFMFLSALVTFACAFLQSLTGCLCL